ncbi:transcription initiation factor TFIID, subunit TAF5 [Lepidopterella palustris CBS 459.81]|uniref:Transcription initiation factor TFIID, subunit TAF5 n=1 Tax=Lepidopterella palustris CBS 459.81 TaxID=1314670 RepID=A0A8E2JGC8_9PEZI|nr:transcription initiation factor TFIID, subunit TAF5 [Lepidopterella palustris CBS 459.81]
MSGPPPGPGGPGSRSVSVSNGPPSAGMPPQQHMQQQQTNVPPPAGAQGGVQSQQNLNQIVLEYLSKKGYNRTEAMLRKESAHQDAEGRPIITRAEESGGAKYRGAYELLRSWIEDNLDLYKPELRRLMWPIFVYSFLDLVKEYYIKESEDFFSKYKGHFANERADEIRALSAIKLPQHLQDSHIAKIHAENKYRLTLSQMAFNSLIQFLESKEREGGGVIIAILTSHMQIFTVDRATIGNERSIAAILARATGDDDMPAEDEGIPGHNPGSANTDRNAPTILPKLALGPLPQEPELQDDVHAALQEEDAKNPPKPGQNSLVEEYEQRIKREPTDDVPTRDTVPLPPSLARDVAMEVQKVIEHRDRFKISGRTGGVGPGVSVTMFTFHNTFDSINCIDFSGDNLLVAAGMAESYVRVWSLEGNALPSPLDGPNTPPSSSRRLIGHSGPVYAVSFSPAIANPNASPSAPSTGPQYLLSCSADKTVRLWSLETWSCLVAYRSHDNPIWDVTWGPHGHYFLTGSHDRTARLWSTDHIEPLKMYVGHDNDVDCVAFHPNNAYVFTGSCDKTVRMWNISTGNALRLFTGHTGNVTAIACAPDGKTLASADDTGAIFLWDLEKGRRKKRMRGHGKGGVWSLSWSVESTVLVSGGADGTVRVWDGLLETSESAGGKVAAEGGAGQKIDAGKGGAGVVGQGGQGKKGGKEVGVSADQIGAFPTKKSPVYKVSFTRMNLVLAGGAYMP